MARAGDDVAVRVAEPLGGVADRLHEARIEGDRVEVAGHLDGDAEAEGLRDLRRPRLDLRLHGVERRLVGRADVDGKTTLPGMTFREFG